MTAATETPIGAPWRVPVPTPLAKALLAATLAQSLHAMYEDLGSGKDDDPLGDLWSRDEVWEPGFTDEALDRYAASLDEVVLLNRELSELRDLQPGPNAELVVHYEYGMLERLELTVKGLTDGDIDRPDLEVRRRVAEAVIAGVDLLEAVDASRGGDE
jgi:hypothetical protein